jgi:hypothetical protein
MPTTGSLMRRAALAACLTLAAAASAFAQPPDQPTVVPAPDAGEFLARYDFHLSAAALAVSDPRFSWDTHFGGSLDVVDYVHGRAGIYVDYEAVLGDEYRLFDPNQGNYTLEANASGRLTSSTEVVGMFHHVSRHLSDRPKRFAVAWNLLGARILQQLKLGGTTIDGDLEGGRIVQNSYVDYAWIGELHLQARRPVSDRLGVYGRASGEWYGIDRSVANRGRQAGGVVELGLRVNGKAGAVELFAGAERRVDADPLDRKPKNWVLAGFRLLGR